MTKSHTLATLRSLVAILRETAIDAGAHPEFRARAESSFTNVSDAYLGGIRFAALFVETEYLGRPVRPALALVTTQPKNETGIEVGDRPRVVKRNPGDVDAPPGQ